MNSRFPHSGPRPCLPPSAALRGWAPQELRLRPRPSRPSRPFPSFLVTGRSFIRLLIQNRSIFSCQNFPKSTPFSSRALLPAPLFTEHTLENEFLHNFNCRLKKPVLETFTVSKITTGALRKLGESVHFRAYLLVCIPDKVIRVDQCYLFWRLVSIDLVLRYLLWGKVVCAC